MTLLAEKRAGKGGGRFGRAAVKTVLKDLGDHPGGDGKIQVLDGKYGPYVSWNKVNATVPKGSEPETLSVDDAIRLLRSACQGAAARRPSAAAQRLRPKPKAAPRRAKTDDDGAKKSAKTMQGAPKHQGRQGRPRRARAKKKPQADAES